MEPAITIQSYSGSFWVLQVASEHAGASHTDLMGQTMSQQKPQPPKTRHRLGEAHFSLSVLSVVLHIRDVDQLHHGAGQRSPDVSWGKRKKEKKRHLPVVRDTISAHCSRMGSGVTCAPVSGHGESAPCGALGLTVTLENKAAQNGSEEGEHGGGDGC